MLLKVAIVVVVAVKVIYECFYNNNVNFMGFMAVNVRFSREEKCEQIR